MKKRFGDRRDGYKVRDAGAFQKFLLRIKPLRCDADVFINQKIDVTNLVKYMEKKKKENPDERFTYFHAFLTAFAKTIYNRPLLNRFVINNNYYDHKDIRLAFVAKVEFTDESKENMVVLKVEDDDNINTIHKKINKYVSDLRNKKDNTTDGAITFLAKLPKWLFNIVAGIVKFMDRHDLLPSSLTENLIYYSSAVISNLGSIEGGAIYHNLPDIGTTSLLITIGEIKKEPYVNEKGEIEIHDFCDFGINLDERIGDGFYFVKSFKMFEYILEHPEMLEEKISEKITQEKKRK